jgi:sialate O-acetylesterase
MKINAEGSFSKIALPAIYLNHMVLQREQPIPLHGHALPDSELRITLAGVTTLTRSDAEGFWQVSLAALPAGGPYELRVECGKETWRISDVLMGDVWVCSGQSNMQWPLGMCTGGGDEAGDLPALRFLRVETLPALQPADEWSCTPQWQCCSSQSIRRISGVAYYFAKRLLQADPSVPIGLVIAAVGGTRIESWMSAEALAAAGVEKSSAHVEPEFEEQLTAFIAGLDRRDVAELPVAARKFALPETGCADWPVMELPCYWQDAGHKFNGAFWFRREVEIPQHWLGRPLQLHLGACDKHERTYFNGHEIGRTDIVSEPDVWARPRRYTVPPELLHPGKTVIAVRVFSNIFGGGMTGPAEVMKLGPEGGETIPLHGPWHYQMESNFGNAVAPHGNQPSRLWNGMVAPLVSFPARGILWYQGESNAGDPALYGRLFPAMIRDWRAKWKKVELPFLFVQLPGYGPVSTWPELRAAQAAALKLPETAMAVAIDQGDLNEIHPPDKQEVGTRLALLALKHCYGHRELVCEGPIVRQVKIISPGQIEISFFHAEGLRAGGTEKVTGFEVAGNDGVFTPLPAATIAEDCVRLTGVQADAAWIRFGWEACPKDHLFNRHGLSASPFCVAVKEFLNKPFSMKG